MKKILLVLLALSGASAHANLLNVECTPNQVKNPWFKKLSITVGREYQVSGSYVGYQNNDDRVVDLKDKSQWMFPQLSSHATSTGIDVVLDFQGRMGNDEDVFTLSIANDGSAVLSGEMMIDCGDGNWQPIEAQAYRCVQK